MEYHCDKYYTSTTIFNYYGFIMHNQEFLNNYFGQVWQPSTDKYLYSGFNLVNKIDNDEWVLDVGCGHNEFKGMIKNIVGIDPGCSQADVVTTIEDYVPDRLFDVAFCLGSINFGNGDTISNQISKVVECLKPKSRIYWRVNPGLRDHNNQLSEQIDFYPWDRDLLDFYAYEYGYECVEILEDTNGSNTRLYAEWVSV
jgi:hypothetical protein